MQQIKQIIAKFSHFNDLHELIPQTREFYLKICCKFVPQ